MNLSFSEMADLFAGMAWSKQTWLRDHPKRAEMDRLQHERQMEACERAAVDYRRAAQRKEEAA